MPLAAETRVQISPSVYSRTFGSETVLLDFGRGEYFALDEVGSEIFRRLEAGEPIGDVASAITKTYEVSSEDALRDIERLVQELQDQGLVKAL